GRLELRRRTDRFGPRRPAAELFRANERFDLRELYAADPERARDPPEQPALREIDGTRRDRRLHLDLDERAREIPSRLELARELGEPFRDGIVRLLAGGEARDRRFDLLGIELERMHDAACYADLLLGDSAVRLRDAAHQLESRPQEMVRDVRRHGPNRPLAAEREPLVEPVTEHHAEQKADGSRGGGADQAPERLP